MEIPQLTPGQRPGATYMFFSEPRLLGFLGWGPCCIGQRVEGAGRGGRGRSGARTLGESATSCARRPGRVSPGCGGGRAWMYKGEHPEPREVSTSISDLFLSRVGGSQLPSSGAVWKGPL